ncbi:hypothetical protein EUX98_g9237 [Antrodiella citrinella]|uniref:Protein kinase domain-containing protein n=1 Tax=Antrodiella citrinella TaxID=2447956 RepID=A0A4S4LYE8_9APHY|nr:hypothetical protein EUX98_g9237 [Antrodiella citrinella]
MIADNYSLHGHLFTPSSSSDTSSSSTRSSHLSVLTSSSSAFDMQEVASPLPSPSFSIASSISKTHAFFSSPFPDGSPTPVPPPNPPSRSASLRSDTSASSADETPRIDPQTPPRSLNADFFGSTGTVYPPPPPSVRSLTASSSAASPESSPPASPPARMLPLSRLFPSRARYVPIDSLPSRDPSANTRRGFFDIEEKTETEQKTSHRQEPYEPEQVSTPVFTSSPSSLPTPFHIQETPSKSEPPSVPQRGDVIYDESKLSLELIRTLGQGAFSSVWLAKDTHHRLSALELTRKSSLLRSRSLNRGRRKHLEGTKPLNIKKKSSGDTSVYLTEESVGPGRPELVVGRLVAVKMTDRRMCETNDRSRVSFVREVEVLRHISHPSIVAYLHSFSTSSHHCLVLEHIGGGELFDLIDSEASHARMDETLLRRIFGELCKAVGWMHGVGLVHRDIKLENILLTTRPFTCDPLPALPHPLIKLTDFGLSRFVDPGQPLLTTRCGSESYAAPELVTGRPYDGRETDAWSCGVVLYTLATRRLPFDKARPREQQHGTPSKPGVREGHEKGRERRALLVRIAKAEYSWPEPDAPLIEDGHEHGEQGMALARREGVHRMVEKLLVRDNTKRAKIIDLWEDEWMKGEGAPIPPLQQPSTSQETILPSSSENILTESPRSDRFGEGPSVDEDYEDEDEDEDDGDGVLVDGDDIGPEHVTRQEH